MADEKRRLEFLLHEGKKECEALQTKYDHDLKESQDVADNLRKDVVRLQSELCRVSQENKKLRLEKQKWKAPPNVLGPEKKVRFSIVAKSGQENGQDELCKARTENGKLRAEKSKMEAEVKKMMKKMKSTTKLLKKDVPEKDIVYKLLEKEIKQ